MRLNATAVSLLGLLDDAGPLTGADLVRVAQVRIGSFWNLTRSQVYRELAALDEAEYVTAGATGPRDARPYDVSDAGRSAMRAWLAEATPPEHIRFGLLVMVALGRQLPTGRLKALLDDAEAHHRDRLAAYEALDARLQAADTDPYVRATLSFGLHYERAVLQWLDGLPPGVRAGLPGRGVQVPGGEP